MTPLQRCQPLTCHNITLLVIRAHLNHQSVSASACLVLNPIYVEMEKKQKSLRDNYSLNLKSFQFFFSFVYTRTVCAPVA